jgi:TrmH family RNA methyltransferase
MLTKKMLKYIQSLHLKKFRATENCFIAEGDKIIREFLKAGKFKLKILCAESKWLENNEDLLVHINNGNIFEVNEQVLSQVSNLKTANDVLGVFERQQFTLKEVKGKFSLMLDDLHDPGNMGTIIRIADWFGIEQIICSENSVDCFNPKVVQSSMGSINRVNISYVDIYQFLKENRDVAVYAATLEGKSIYELPKLNEGIIIIGNESQGIGPEILKLDIHRISIPGIGHAESLNAAVAAGIIISHITMASPK